MRTSLDGNLELAYFCLAGSGLCPVKEYLRRYDPQDTHEQRLLSDILNKLEYVCQIRGIGLAPFYKRLSGTDLLEIKQRRDENILIRIIGLIWKEKLILLHAFEKPDNYQTGKVRREIAREMALAKRYQQDFLNNHLSYEK